MTVEADGAACRRGLEDLAAGLVQAAGLALRQAILAVEASGRETHLFRDRTGATRASIRGQVESARAGFVVFGGVSRLLDSGTRPHEIWARNATVLRFQVAGQTMFRKMVHHPGTAERPFVRQARERGAQVAEYAADYFVSEAIRRAR